MQMKPIRGKNIVEAGYEPVAGILAVRFFGAKTGKTEWHYSGVPENIWVSLQRVPFPDKYFHQTVRGRFTGTKIEDPPEEANGSRGSNIQNTAGRDSNSGASRHHARPNSYSPSNEGVDDGRRLSEGGAKGVPDGRCDAQRTGGRVMEFFRAEDGLTFTEEGHKYHLQAKPLISLTQILDAAGLVDYSAVAPDVLANKASFGTKVHEYTMLHDTDDLDPEDWAKLLNHPKYGPRLKGWVQFCEDFHFTPDPNWIEVPCAVKLNGMTYAMTVDRFGILGTKEEVVAGKGMPAVVEIKTCCDREPSHQIQTAGQAIPFRGDGSVPMKRYAVYLLDKPNGGGKFYFAQEHTERTDEKVFLCALTLVQFRINNKLLKG